MRACLCVFYLVEDCGPYVQRGCMLLTGIDASCFTPPAQEERDDTTTVMRRHPRETKKEGGGGGGGVNKCLDRR